MRILMMSLGLVLAGCMPLDEAGNDCESAQDPQRVLDSCNAVLAAAPEENAAVAWVFTNRGWAYRELGEPARAIADYSRSIALNPDRPNAHYARGRAHQQVQAWSAAIADHERAIEINPTFVDAWVSLGVAHFELRQFEDALAATDRAIEIDPEEPVAYNNRGLTYRNLGQLRRAIEDYDRALALEPDYHNARVGRGVAYQLLGEADRALADWNRAIEGGDADDVIEWQEFLQREGLYSGPISGEFDAATRAAVAACAADPEC